MPEEIYWSAGSAADQIIESLSPVVKVSPEAMEKASYRSERSGFIALFRHHDTSLDSLPEMVDPLILVAEQIEKPGNLGAMLRIADGAGVDALVVADPTADPFNPNAVRSSTGAIFTVPIAIASLEDTQQWLQGSKVRGVAAVPDAATVLWDVDLRGAVAIWIGSEADGLSDRALRVVSEQMAIPMRGKADSLNASVSAAVIVFEAVRQRSVNR